MAAHTFTFTQPSASAFTAFTAFTAPKVPVTTPAFPLPMAQATTQTTAPAFPVPPTTQSAPPVPLTIPTTIPALLPLSAQAQQQPTYMYAYTPMISLENNIPTMVYVPVLVPCFMPMSTIPKDPEEDEMEVDAIGTLQINPCAPKQTNQDIWLSPSLEVLQQMTNEQLASVRNFRINHRAFGNVFWPGSVDLRDLNLDNIIDFSLTNLKVYPIDKDLPPVGVGLNKLCRVTLFHVEPKTTEEKNVKTGYFVERLQRMCKRQHTTFVAYRPIRREWTFDVSKW